MSVNPWCFNAATEALNKLPEAAAAFKAEFERIHSLIDQSEWEQIVAPMELEEYVQQEYLTKPPAATSGFWWDSTDPDCWSEAKEKLSFYDISTELAELEAIAMAYASTALGQPTIALSIDYISEQIVGYFGSATTKLLPFNVVRIEQAANEIYNNRDPSIEDAALKAWFDKTTNVIGGLASKLRDIPCPSIEYFKSIYQEAVIEISKKLKEIDEKIAIEEIRRKDPSYLVANAQSWGNLEKERKKKIEALRLLNATIEGKIEEELEEAFADNIAYSQQCILLSFMEDLVDSKKARDKAFGKIFLPYSNAGQPTNAPLRILGEPFGFVNRLVVDPSQKEFFKIKNSTLSSLVPHIRFYKVESDDKGRDVETEITFDSNGRNSAYDTEILINKKNPYRRQRGHGVGMKSFNFSYDGTDPFSAKKMIAAKLSIYAATFDELLRERQDPTGKSFKYAELALKTGGVGIDGNKKSLSDIERENLEKLNFRLKATLGWSIPDSKSFSKLSDDLKDAIYDSFITIYLTPTIHNFSFDETGATVFDIEYLAYIEDAFAQSTYNIFSSLTKEKESREVIFNYFEELGCDITNSSNEQFKIFRKADENIISQINGSAFQEIMGSLQKKERVYYLNFTKQDTEKLNRNPADSNVKFPEPVSDITQGINYATAIEDATKTASDGTLEGVDADEALLSIVAASQENNSIPYFYFGDLIDVVMELIELDLVRSAQDITSSKYYENIFKNGGISKFDKFKIEKKIIGQKTKKFRNHLEQFRKMRVILGPMEMFTPLKTDGTILCSIADIPISTSYFFDFMSDRVLSKDIISYPFSKFIKDIINDLIANFLNSDGCTRVDNSQKIKLNSTTICAYNQNRFGSVDTEQRATCLDDITHAIIHNKKYVKGEPPLTLSGKRGVDSTKLSIDRMMSYFVFTVGRRSPISNYVGNKIKDESVGIFHYMIGQNNGFVKNITLEKTTATGLKEVRFEQEGYNGLEQLREVYNAKIETFLNVQTFPGVYVYVEPGGFAPNTTQDLTRFGIGGYCMVTRTEHSIAPGVADTTLHTVWVASKEGDKSKNDKNRASSIPVVRQPEGKEKIKKCLVGPHYIGLLATGRGKYSGLNAKERGDLGSEVIESGAYTMVGWDEGEV